MTILRQILGRIAFAGMRAIGALKRGLVRISAHLAPPIVVFGRFLARCVLLPAYRVFFMLRLRIGNVMLSARSLLFLIFANRYVFHGVIAALCLATIATQLQTRSATALDAGQRSLLYSLVTDGSESLVEETVRPELEQKNIHYLGAATIDPVPHIDFDYTYADELPADLAVPGTIALLPGAEEPGQPGQALIRTSRTTVETYTIQAGDTISTIAQKFGINIGTVLWANGLTERSLIRPGNTLKILPVSGVLYVVKKNDTLGKIANTYDADQNDILTANRLADAGSLRIGDELIVPGGTPPASAPVPTRSTIAIRPDVPISRIANKATDIYQELTGKADSRAKPVDEIEDAAKPKAKLLWPTRQHIINQYYGWKHTGLDIEGDYVDPIYAAEDGVVETAGWNSGGYGLQIIVNHGGGTKTRYAHSSKMFVKVGDVVKRGQTIAMIGTTGRSTGTHLHFEVYINNKRVNPLAYIK